MHPSRLALLLLGALAPTIAAAHGRPDFAPGAPGIGDPYFPLDGNGGYDVDDYHLAVTYDPDTDQLTGEATIRARATQDLSRFNLDLVDLTVDSIRVEHRAASFTRDGGELTVTPARGLRRHERFEVVVRYHGIPTAVTEGPLAEGGFIHTADGAVVAGEPLVAAHWFPANDHPRDAATFTLDLTAPADREVIAVGQLVDKRTRRGWTTWRWRSREPMATYLVAWTVGKYATTEYRAGDLRVFDAIDASLFVPPVQPTSGTALAVSGQADLSWKRITREIAVPAGGAELSFNVYRDTERFFDYFFVEARVAGSESWTTLPDVDGHAAPDLGSCSLFFLHPFMGSYASFNPAGPPFCIPSGATGDFFGATGQSGGWERWRVDLGAYAGQTVEISLSYASDDIVQRFGVAIDDIAVSTGEGTTTFEGGDTGGWQLPGAPPPLVTNANDWFVGGPADLPPPLGERIAGTLEREPEIIAFLASHFGEYPFRDLGAIVHTAPGIGFALENQTRPTYPGRSFAGASAGVSLVVHELAHQWYGDQVRVDAWKHIWLNEGFATYAQWLWADEKDGIPIDDIFASYYAIPEDDPFWQVVIGDPTPPLIFEFAIYGRGALTLHVLRRAVGDEAFFAILERWAACAHTGSTEELIALAEAISGQELDALFDSWLFTAGRPALEAPPAALRTAAAPERDERADQLRRTEQRLGKH